MMCEIKNCAESKDFVEVSVYYSTNLCQNIHFNVKLLKTGSNCIEFL